MKNVDGAIAKWKNISRGMRARFSTQRSDCAYTLDSSADQSSRKVACHILPKKLSDYSDSEQFIPRESNSDALNLKSLLNNINTRLDCIDARPNSIEGNFINDRAIVKDFKANLANLRGLNNCLLDKNDVIDTRLRSITHCLKEIATNRKSTFKVNKCNDFPSTFYRPLDNYEEFLLMKTDSKDNKVP